LANQNLKDRFHGKNDPVAARILNKLLKTNNPQIEPPSDTTITSLYLSNLPLGVSEHDIY